MSNLPPQICYETKVQKRYVHDGFWLAARYYSYTLTIGAPCAWPLIPCGHFIVYL
ncbi:hypothetical protein LZ31DRAFT_548173 [Colletotrichum somersetense]|nr:hypothetical protein LZ31DRAFT_548173 [Colletotrichum somersetense]